MRVRFAPSPTGALHIGGARTALFNWLLARHEEGELVLRIEDTDRERSTRENVQQILDALAWLELDWDEGPVFQSEHSERHRAALEALLEAGHAYRSNATAEDVKAFKQRHGAERGFRGEPEASGAVRLRVPDSGATVVHDVIRGDTQFEHVHLDDPVIARADGSVLYNFAVAIDDLDAGITHVVRGEEHLSNTPKQLLGRVGEMLLATHDMRDPGVEVVDGDRKVVQDRSVRARDHGVVQMNVLKLGVAADHIVDHRRAAVGHPQPNRARGLWLTAEASLRAVALLVGLDVLGGRVRAVCVARLQQCLERRAVTFGVLALKHRALVPVELEPGER